MLLENNTFFKWITADYRVLCAISVYMLFSIFTDFKYILEGAATNNVLVTILKLI